MSVQELSSSPKAGRVGPDVERLAAAKSSPRLLSVIIPAHNAAGTLGDQLEALKAQVYDGDWEVIVVDNCSQDDLAGLIRCYQPVLPNLRLVQASQMRGASYARNTGVEVSRANAFLFSDADDVVAPGWVAALAQALKEHDLVAGMLDELPLPGRPPRQRTALRTFAASPFLNFLPFATANNLALSRQAFEAVGGFRTGFPRNQDVDLCWRLQLLGYRLHVAPEAVVYCRPRSSLRTVWKVSVASGAAEVNLYRHFSASGMPPFSKRGLVRKYVSFFSQAPHLWSPDIHKRERWLRQVGYSWGRIRGSFRYRTLYL